MGTYFIIVTCRNSEKNTEAVLTSLKNQTLKPEYVIVIDDGSTDKTPEILKKIQTSWNNLHIITNPDFGYNIGRVVSNWNKAIKLVQELNLKETDYHMISTDDTIYDEDYAEKILSLMDIDTKLAIVSGNYDDAIAKSPHGAGRFIRNSFFVSNYGLYPEKMGYESAILHMAKRRGYTYAVLNHVKFKHIRKLGIDHKFYEFGASMRTLGYHPLFVFGRFITYFVTGKPIGRKGAINMFYYYLTYTPKNDGYDSMYDKDFREFIRKTQCSRIKSILKGKIIST
jgi:glycosyltransferase involved in cell wall biosynthesis